MRDVADEGPESEERQLTISFSLSLRAWAKQLQQQQGGGERALAVRVASVDFTRPLAEQGFDCVLQKLCGHLASEASDPIKRRELELLEEYLTKGDYDSAAVAVDSVSALRLVNDRRAVACELASLHEHWDGHTFTTPPFHIADTVAQARSAPFPLPWIVKPALADGAPAAHAVRVVRDLNELEESFFPALMQPFVAHGGVLLKVYALGARVASVARPSIDDDFASGVVPRTGARTLGEGSKKQFPFEPPPRALWELVCALRVRLQLEVFGLDLICCAPGQWLLIDVNHLPGYYGVADVFAGLLDVCWAAVCKRRSTMQVAKHQHQKLQQQLQQQQTSGLASLPRALLSMILSRVCGDYCRAALALASTCRQLRTHCNSDEVWRALAAVRLPVGTDLSKFHGLSCLRGGWRGLVLAELAGPCLSWRARGGAVGSSHDDSAAVSTGSCVDLTVDASSSSLPPSPAPSTCVTVLRNYRTAVCARVWSRDDTLTRFVCVKVCSEALYFGIGACPVTAATLASFVQSSAAPMWLRPLALPCWVLQSGLWAGGTRRADVDYSVDQASIR